MYPMRMMLVTTIAEMAAAVVFVSVGLAKAYIRSVQKPSPT
jgi:hypothetical protein